MFGKSTCCQLKPASAHTKQSTKSFFVISGPALTLSLSSSHQNSNMPNHSVDSGILILLLICSCTSWMECSMEWSEDNRLLSVSVSNVECKCRGLSPAKMQYGNSAASRWRHVKTHDAYTNKAYSPRHTPRNLSKSIHLSPKLHNRKPFAINHKWFFNQISSVAERASVVCVERVHTFIPLSLGQTHICQTFPYRSDPTVRIHIYNLARATYGRTKREPHRIACACQHATTVHATQRPNRMHVPPASLPSTSSMV